MKRYWKRLALACGAILLVVHAITYAGILMVGMQRSSGEFDTQKALVIGLLLFGSLLVLWACAAALLWRLDRIFTERNNRLRRIMATTSHELKTPLTLTMANLDLLEMENGSDELIDDMREEGQHMTRLVEKMVALSRMEEGQWSLSITTVNIGRLMSRCLEHFRPLGKSRGLGLNVQIAEGMFCDIDESELKQVFFILLDNACKYCDEGGTVYVSVQPEGAMRVAIRLENTCSEVHPEEFNHLFDQFYRGGNAEGISGEGLGLAIALKSVKIQEGTLEVYESKVRGAIGFKVTFVRSFC